MNKLTRILPAIAAVALLFAPSLVRAASDEAVRVRAATEILTAVMNIPEQGIPETLLKNSYGVAVFPGVIKAGLGIGGTYGHGVLVVRDVKGAWTNPIFLTMTGGSVGWQAGVQSNDLILVFKTRRGVDDLMNGEFTLGAQASVAAGPVGRYAEAGTNAQLRSEIFSYSRSRGLFAGVSLEGAVLSIDNRANATYYGNPDVTPRSIIAHRGINAPPGASGFSCMVARYSGTSQVCG